MELKDYATVTKWLSAVAPSTAAGYLYHMKWFMKYVEEHGGKFSKMNPDQLVEYQRTSDNGTQYEILDMIQAYVSSKKGRYGYLERLYAASKSFFSHNRAQLPKDPNFKFRPDIPPVVGELKPEEVRDVILSSKPVYQAVFLSMLQGAVDGEGMEYWNQNGYEKLVEDLAKNPDLIRIDLPGRKSLKNIKPYYTLVGPDSIKALRDWLKIRQPGPGPIFIDQFKKAITKQGARLYWVRHLRKLGLAPLKEKGTPRTRTGKSPHELRDVFRTLWEKSPAKGSVAEFLMGHSVDKLEYNKACRDEEWVRREYRKALPLLQIITGTEAYGLTTTDTVEDLKQRIRELEAIDEQRSQQMREDVKTQLDTFKEEIEAYKIILGKQAEAENQRIEEQVTEYIRKNPEKFGILPPEDPQ